MDVLGAGAGADLLVAAAVLLPVGVASTAIAVAGARLGGANPERSIPLLLLSLGWLQASLTAAGLARPARAGQLLELLGHVSAQHKARGAAQEWVNRMAAWARAEMAAERSGSVDAVGAGAELGLTLFSVRHGTPAWWVSADTAWAETGASGLQAATELAAGAAVQDRELALGSAWALPLHERGEVVAVLVLSLSAAMFAAMSAAMSAENRPGPAVLAFDAAPGLPEPTLALLRAAATLAEPLLRHWRQAERGLPRHAVAACAQAWRRLWGPGHLAFKATALLALAVLAGLTCVPVADRVNANAVIEGGVRQLVTAPFEGFIAQALVRPGEAVLAGQVLLRLDDRDLRLDQAKASSERDTAEAKLRQAMADRDAPALALARADLGQAGAQLALVEAKLARSTLRAPMAGLVVSGDWVQQLGSPVETGKELFEIAATDAYKVVLHLPERDIARVHPGQLGVLRLAGQPDTAQPFTLTRVVANASVQDGVNGFRVEAAWHGEAGQPVPALSPGMQGIGKVEVGQSNLLTLWTRPSLEWLQLKLWSWWW